MKSFRSWWNSFKSKDRRRADRHQAPKLAAYYWDGGRPKAHSVRDISSTGLYLVTEERWYPRTLVRMTLQKIDPVEDGAERSIAVESMVVRWGTDGVGLVFVPPDLVQHHGGDDRISNGADTETLEKFLREISSSNVEVSVESVVQQE